MKKYTIPKTPKRLFEMISPKLNKIFIKNDLSHCKIEYDGQSNRKGGMKYKIWIQADYIDFHNKMLITYGGEQRTIEQQKYVDKWVKSIIEIRKEIGIYFNLHPFLEYLTVKEIE